MAVSGAEPRWLWYLFLTAGVALLGSAGYLGYVLYPRFALPPAVGAGLLVLAFGAGAASFFSPCSFPLLVALLGRETGIDVVTAAGRLARALQFAAGMALGATAFLLLTGAAIGLGGAALLAGVTFASPAGVTIRAVVGLLLVLLGLVQIGVLPVSFHGVERVARPLLRWQAEVRRRNAVLGFALFGFGYILAGFG